MKKLLQKAIILPIIIALAVALVILKVKTKPAIEHEELQFPTRTVEVITLKKLPFRARAVAYGHIEPAILFKAKAEVSGKISYIHPSLKKGGSVAKGTVVLRIEPTIFEFSRDQSEAGLAGSQSSLTQLVVEEKATKRSLEIAKKNLQVGQKELDRLITIRDKGLIARSVVDSEEQKVLQLSQQVEDLKGKLASYSSRKSVTRSQIKQSQTQLAQSQDTLGRTEVHMPFDARIGMVSVEEGEVTATGNVLFEALGTDAVEINAQLPTNQFRPLLSGFGKQPINLQDPEELQLMLTKMQLDVYVKLVGFDDVDIQWHGKLLRIGESIDPTRDTVSLIVAVNHPYEDILPGKRPPLLKGMYTAVEFFAPAQDMLVVPRKAIHQGRIYVANDDNKLEIRAVNILHKQGQLVIIDSGVNEGERLIINDVIPVIEGLPLRPSQSDEYENMLAQVALGLRDAMRPGVSTESKTDGNAK